MSINSTDHVAILALYAEYNSKFTEVVARGLYEDIVERPSDGWRFKERRLAML